MREMPVKRAGQILGESDSRMQRMLFAHVKAAQARLSFDNVVWVGADEMNRRKGHNYLTVFADLLAKRVLFATLGKDASVWEAFAAELLRHNGHWTQGLTTAFMEGLNSLFSAVKRKACGYRTVEYMTAMLYFVAGKLTRPCY
jgi:hypothetical protein